jgi:hypothetical protein
MLMLMVDLDQLDAFRPWLAKSSLSYRHLAALMTASVETTMPEANSCNIDFVLQQMDGIQC